MGMLHRKSDGSLEIPITLDARISIPDYQKGLNHIFKNYTPSISPRFPQVGGVKNTSHKEDYHPRNGPQKTSGKAALETLFDMALLGQLDETELSPSAPPDRSNIPPAETIYRSPQELYKPPKEQSGHYPTTKSPKPTPSQITKSYIAPTPAASYEPPRLPAYKERTTGALYTPPSQEYIPPENSKLYTSYDLPKERKTPNTKYAPPKAKEPKQLYDLPRLPEYQNPQPPKIEQTYSAPKLPTSYLPPSILYTPPKSKENHEPDRQPSVGYEPPKSLYSPPTEATPFSIYSTTPHTTYHKSEPYDTPIVHHLQHHGYASLLGPTDSYRKPEGEKKIYAEVYHLTPEGSYGPVDKSLIKELPLPEVKYKEPHGPNNIYTVPKDLVFPTDVPQHIYKSPPEKPIRGSKLSYESQPPKDDTTHGKPTYPETHPSGSAKATYRKGVKTPVGYEYPTPAGYSPDNNPTFPQPTQSYALPRQQLEEGYKPPLSHDYRKASKRPTISDAYTSHLPHIHDPTFPSDVEEFPGLGLSYTYTPAPEARSANKAMKHSFNIIIKNEVKPQSNAAYSPPKEGYNKSQAPNFGSLLAAQEPTSAVKLAKNVARKVR